MAKPTIRNQQVVRQWQLLLALQARPCGINQLARDLDVATRTIRRDLEALEMAGFPLFDTQDDDRVVRWHLMPTATTPGRRAV